MIQAPRVPTSVAIIRPRVTAEFTEPPRKRSHPPAAQASCRPSPTPFPLESGCSPPVSLDPPRPRSGSWRGSPHLSENFRSAFRRKTVPCVLFTLGVVGMLGRTCDVSEHPNSPRR